MGNNIIRRPEGFYFNYQLDNELRGFYQLLV